MTMEEEKMRAKIEKERLIMRIAMRSNEYSLEQLRSMTLKKLQKVAAELNL